MGVLSAEMPPTEIRSKVIISDEASAMLAKETAALSHTQLRQQAGSALLAQANQSPAALKDLMRG
jgi:flagellin-like hook-associated protein FlgL